MTAKKQRANDDHQDDLRRNGEGQGESEAPGEPETARSQANAKAAAEEAARLAEAEAGGEAAAEPAGEASETEQLRAEVADLRNRLQRAMAETENVRRRADRERQEAVKYAATPLAKDIIGVADNLRRALESAPADAGDDALKTLLTGVEMTEKELAETLAKHGVRKIEAKPGDRFDPHRHEAMFEMPSDQHAPGSIVQVVQSGYLLNDRLLRPARVGVARAADGGSGKGNGSGSGGNVDTKA